MIRKRKIRELAMQVLFLWDAQGDQDLLAARQFVDESASDDVAVRQPALDMASGTWVQRETIDPMLDRHAPQWPVRRQSGVDRAILRLAVFEMTNTQTPAKVVIDEAIEMAKHFSTEQSPSFVNGVLDAVLKEIRALTGTQEI
jgi:transcription antitermination protein NusB